MDDSHEADHQCVREPHCWGGDPPSVNLLGFSWVMCKRGPMVKYVGALPGWSEPVSLPRASQSL